VALTATADPRPAQDRDALGPGGGYGFHRRFDRPNIATCCANKRRKAQLLAFLGLPREAGIALRPLAASRWIGSPPSCGAADAVLITPGWSGQRAAGARSLPRGPGCVVPRSPLATGIDNPMGASSPTSTCPKKSGAYYQKTGRAPRRLPAVPGCAWQRRAQLRRFIETPAEPARTPDHSSRALSASPNGRLPRQAAARHFGETLALARCNCRRCLKTPAAADARASQKALSRVPHPAAVARRHVVDGVLSVPARPLRSLVTAVSEYESQGTRPGPVRSLLRPAHGRRLPTRARCHGARWAPRSRVRALLRGNGGWSCPCRRPARSVVVPPPLSEGQRIHRLPEQPGAGAGRSRRQGRADCRSVDGPEGLQRQQAREQPCRPSGLSRTDTLVEIAASQAGTLSRWREISGIGHAKLKPTGGVLAVLPAGGQRCRATGCPCYYIVP